MNGFLGSTRYGASLTRNRDGSRRIQMLLSEASAESIASVAGRVGRLSDSVAAVSQMVGY